MWREGPHLWLLRLRVVTARLVCGHVRRAVLAVTLVATVALLGMQKGVFHWCQPKGERQGALSHLDSALLMDKASAYPLS